MKGSEMFVVGGANSAGQAEVHLARYAARVTVLVRGRSLADSMSDYLIREIESAANIAVRCRVAVTGGTGQSRLESLTLTDLDSGEAETADAMALLVMIGPRRALSGCRTQCGATGRAFCLRGPTSSRKAGRLRSDR